ncbi:MAG: hypothetical protein DRN01_05660 [Thermoplasmata archaeon]|nr:MAG: hypothetical protein DRN01_05660 [Thermoplasmata archaeon]
MGFLDRFRKTKEQTEKQVNEKTDQKTTVETKTTVENTGHIKAEYHEVLYSQDYTGKRKTQFSPAPPRREWENISNVEKKIDRLSAEGKKKALSAVAVEKKVDRLLSTKPQK